MRRREDRTVVETLDICIQELDRLSVDYARKANYKVAETRLDRIIERDERYNRRKELWQDTPNT